MGGLVVRYLRGDRLNAIAVTDVIGGTPFVWDSGVMPLPEWLAEEDIHPSDVWIAPVESMSADDLRIEFT
jgi:hypothetical protein